MSQFLYGSIKTIEEEDVTINELSDKIIECEECYVKLADFEVTGIGIGKYPVYLCSKCLLKRNINY